LFKSVVGSFWCVGVKWVVEQANDSKEKRKGIAEEIRLLLRSMLGFVNCAHLGAYMAVQFDSRWVELNTSSEWSLRWKEGNSINHSE
jgi:hypothetical protein